MVRVSRTLLRDAVGTCINKNLSDILVCPLSKQPLRFCDTTGSLISDAVGVSFPVKDGIPCLVPKDGKLLSVEEERVDLDPPSSRHDSFEGSSAATPSKGSSL